MPPNSLDHAVVIGIAQYPRLARHNPPQPHHLQGPENDARAVRDWLVDPAGGNLPPRNVRLVCSADYPSGGTGRPIVDDLRQVLDDLRAVADGAPAPLRRLYLYATGHGFGRKRNEGGVFMSDASPVDFTHLYVSSYLDWFVHAARFEEYVLLVDACMDQGRLVQPEVAHWRPVVAGAAHRGRVFTAYAARFNGLAVEREMSSGQWHGVFTHALLLGLRGAAAVPGMGGRMEVTTHSLRDYLINTMRLHMSPAQRANPTVSDEPDFGETDRFVLVPDCAPATPVRLPLPAHLAGRRLTLRDARLAPVGTVVAAASDAATEVALAAGFYSVEEPGGWRAAFEVVGGGMPVTLTPAPVLAPAGG